MTEMLKSRLLWMPAGLLLCLACKTAEARMYVNPDPTDLQTGITLYQQGKYAEAEGALKSASGPEADAYMAASLVKQRRYSEAEPRARSAVQANPTHPVAVAALGEALVGQKKLDEAVDRMSAAVNAKSDQAYAYFWRGQAYYQKKQPDRMVGDFNMFLKLAPKAPEAPTVQALLASFR
jgi:tetratricopeptide (TPR) repeat protein